MNLFFLKFLLSVLLFFSLPNWVLAASCEGGFANEDIFISFAKKLKGGNYEKKLGTDWSRKVAENIEHWTRMEVLQFLDFLGNRIGEIRALSTIYIISSGMVNISFKEFMEMVRFYDQISKDIIDALLYQMNEHTAEATDYFFMFIRNYTLDKVKAQELSKVLGSYFGGVGIAHVMGRLPIHEVDLQEIGKVMGFVNAYIRKHGGVPNTLENRVYFFREVVRMDITQKRPKIILKNFDELRQFGGVLVEEIRRGGTDSTTVRNVSDLLNSALVLKLLEVKVNGVFYGLSSVRKRTLIETVRVLEEYIEPKEVAELMVNVPEIYLVNPKHLKEVINILKQEHDLPNDRTIIESEDKIKMVDSNHVGVSLMENFFETKMLVVMSSKELITVIMKENIGYLLLANPIYLQNTISILKKYLTKLDVALMLRHKIDQHVLFQRGLLEIANTNSLQKIVTALEKIFEKHEITEILVKIFFHRLFELRHSFAELTKGNPTSVSTALTADFFPRIWIEMPDQFVNIVGLFRTYIEQRSVLLQRIYEVIEEIDSYSIEDLYDTLVRISRTQDHDQMARILNSNISLSELSPKIQETKMIENMISEEVEEPKEPILFH